MQEKTEDRFAELLEFTRLAREKAAEANTGLPCDVCGAKQQRINIHRTPDGGVSVSISYLIPPSKVLPELIGLAKLLKSFASGL